MTKYSKIAKSSFAIIVLSLVLVALLAFGGTYAFFTDKAEVTASTKTGVMGFSAPTTITIAEQSWVPNQQIGLTGVNLTYDADSNVIAALKATVVISGKGANNMITVNTDAVATAGWLVDTADVSTDNEYTQEFYFGKTFIGGGANDVDNLDGILLTLKSTAGNDYQNQSYSITITLEMVQAEFATSSTNATYTDGGELDGVDAAKAIFTAVGTTEVKA